MQTRASHIHATLLGLSSLIASTSFLCAQTNDQSNCPDCSQEEIALVSEVFTKYQGIKGSNPSVPSTYGLIGTHKFSGTGWGITNEVWGENWYPVRTEKQTLTGTFHHFGVSNHGDESDWNIHLLPDNGFEDFIADAIPYRRDNLYAQADWGTTAEGKFLIEAEITPDESRYGNPWFPRDSPSLLINKRISVYGPFVREEAHGNHPEIHPAEQIWWSDGDIKIVLLVVDDSNRFIRPASGVVVGDPFHAFAGDYTARRATTPNHQPWVREKAQEAELRLPFEINPAEGALHMGIQALDDRHFYSGASYPDAGEGDKSTVSYKGIDILTVQEAAPVDPFVGVTFQNVCFNRAKGMLQGYVVLKTAIGNGAGKEGFVALRIDQQRAGFDQQPALETGDLANTWRVHAPYDNQVAFSDIISSDMNGKGIVSGMIDFNGNGKTDLFAKKGDLWMVLYDGKGTWQTINSSSIPVSELRFGDVDGDKKTDILRSGPGKKIFVSYGGVGQWTVITDAGEQNQMHQVGDFNGDGKVDLINLKYLVYPARPFRADMMVKFSCQGPWKTLNHNYVFTSADDYSKNFRFGDFNGDRITDIFKYDGKKFLVFWNGTGSSKELTTPGFSLRVQDLLFVDKLSGNNTDIIHVDPTSKAWTVFYGGRPGSLPLRIKNADPAIVRFGDLDTDPAVEPFAKGTMRRPRSPRDLNMAIVPKATIQPTTRMRYVPGSVRRDTSKTEPALSVSMNLTYYPGTISQDPMREELRAIKSVSEQRGSKNLTLTAAPLSLTAGSEGEVIGTIADVPLSGATENHLQLMSERRAGPLRYKLPVYAITGVPSSTLETEGGNAGDWAKWREHLAATAKSDKTSLLSSPPAAPTRVKTTSFELCPLYSSLEERKVRLSEMDDLAKELNDIAYGTDAARLNEVFGNREIFVITWQSELVDVATGKILPIGPPDFVVSDGKWPKNKISFNFPDHPGLLQLKVTATIKDSLGNSSVEPLEFTFWNQRIKLTDPDKQLADWLRPIGNTRADYLHLLKKSKYLAEDNLLTPAELGSLVR